MKVNIDEVQNNKIDIQVEHQLKSQLIPILFIINQISDTLLLFLCER